MARFLSPLLLLAALSSASASVPAPLNGIWKLTGMTPSSEASGPMPAVQMFIVGSTIRGNIGCGTYTGSVDAAQNRLTLQVKPQPPRANERCLYAMPGTFHTALNQANRYVISQDTRQLIFFSTTGRLTFQRIGYVTPAKN